MSWSRGLFRLWLVVSVIWIGGIALVTWQVLSPNLLFVERNPPPPGFVVDKPPSIRTRHLQRRHQPTSASFLMPNSSSFTTAHCRPPPIDRIAAALRRFLRRSFRRPSYLRLARR